VAHDGTAPAESASLRPALPASRTGPKPLAAGAPAHARTDRTRPPACQRESQAAPASAGSGSPGAIGRRAGERSQRRRSLYRGVGPL
jgi:hypothetical protein